MIIIALIIICIVVVILVTAASNDNGTHNVKTFDFAFQQRMGQDPTSYVACKLKSGSDLGAIRYLFDIVAAEIELKSKCKSPGFDYYYAKAMGYPPAMPVEKTPAIPTSPAGSFTGSTEKHRWTVEEDIFCCRSFFDRYVIQKSAMNLQQFAEQLHSAMPGISVGSLRMKTQNIQQLCIEYGITNSLAAHPLAQYSQQNRQAFLQVMQEYGFPVPF